VRIAIDFDDTLTADPRLWSLFINEAYTLGHYVICVTARRDTEENNEIIDQFMEEWGIDLPVYFTSLQSKVDYKKARGVQVDIWIDDDPKRCALGH